MKETESNKIASEKKSKQKMEELRISLTNAHQIEKNSLNKSIAILKSQINTLNDANSTLKGSVDYVSKENAGLKEEIGKINDDLTKEKGARQYFEKWNVKHADWIIAHNNKWSNEPQYRVHMG